MPPFETPDAKPQANPQIPEMPPSGPPAGGDDDSVPTFAGMQDHSLGDFSHLGPEFSHDVPDSGQPGAQPAQQPSQQPSPQPSQPQAPPPTGADPLGAALAQQGIDVSRFASPQEALGELTRMAAEARQNQSYVQLGRQAAPYWDQFQQFQQQAGQPQQPQQPAQPQSQPQDPDVPQWQWQAPEWNPRWLDQIDRNTGQLKPGADPTILTKIQNYQDWQEQQLTSFLSDPSQLISQAVAPKLHEMNKSVEQLVGERVKAAIEEYQAQERQRAAQQESEQRWSQIESKLIAKGPTGQPLTDPLTGQPALTPQGKFFQQASQRGFQEAQRLAQASGQQITAEQAQAYALDFAYREFEQAEKGGLFGQPNGQQPAQPAQGQPPQTPGAPSPAPSAPDYDAIAAQQRQSFMQEALAGQQQQAGNRDGSLPDNPAVDPAQNPMRPKTASEAVNETLRSMGLQEYA